MDDRQQATGGMDTASMAWHGMVTWQGSTTHPRHIQEIYLVTHIYLSATAAAATAAAATAA